MSKGKASYSIVIFHEWDIQLQVSNVATAKNAKLAIDILIDINKERR
jgi:hypothetical protein